MNLRKHALETVTLVVAAILCALVSNVLAARERKLQIVGNYPNALKVPQSSTSPAPITAAPITTATMPVETTASIAPVTTTTSPVSTTTTAPSAAVPATDTRAAAPPTATSPPPAPARPDLSRFAPHPDKAYVEIHGDDVAALHAGGALFLDARRTSVYEQGHIAGARSFSVWEADIDQKVNALYEERNDPRQQLQPIVIYCSGGDCEDSHMLAQKLWGLQFNNIYVYKDGFPDWQKRGQPVRTGSNP